MLKPLQKQHIGFKQIDRTFALTEIQSVRSMSANDRKKVYRSK